MIKYFLESFIESIEGQFVIKVIACMLIGFFIGKERQAKGKNAGVSTFTLVLTGSMLFTFLGSAISAQDPGRIAAGIVTGIGFLGAGLIIKDGTNVINLTTAAGIRLAGAIGMAIGVGYYSIAIISACVAIMVASGSDTLVKRKKKVSHATHKKEESITE